MQKKDTCNKTYRDKSLRLFHRRQALGPALTERLEFPRYRRVSVRRYAPLGLHRFLNLPLLLFIRLRRRRRRGYRCVRRHRRCPYLRLAIRKKSQARSRLIYNTKPYTPRLWHVFRGARARVSPDFIGATRVMGASCRDCRRKKQRLELCSFREAT